MTAAAPPAPLSRPDPPTVVGVSGGVGTSTLAVALAGCDLGVFAGRAADVVICRGTVASVLMAGRVAALCARPIVAVVAIDTAKPGQPLTSRLQLLEPHTAAVVLVPHVPQWRDVVDPLTELRRNVSAPLDELPRSLHRYIDAVALLQDALHGRADSAQAVRS
jgi:hypothetical protein